MRTALVVAVTGSALAGLIHAAAAKEHNGDRTLFWMFVSAPSRNWRGPPSSASGRRAACCVTGIVINGGAVFVWFLSRTTGIPFIDALHAREAVGSQDLAGALYAGASVAAAGGHARSPGGAPHAPTAVVRLGGRGGVAARDAGDRGGPLA